MSKLLTQIGTVGANHERLAQKVIKNSKLVEEVLAGLNAESARTRFGCAKVLRSVSQKQPEVLYPHFNFFVALLDSDNNIFQWEAIHVLSHLVRVDTKKKFNRIFNRYFAPISGPVLVTAANIIGAAARIAQAKPRWADRIAAQVLRVARARYRTPECRKVAFGQAIATFDQIYDLLKDKTAVAQFVRKQRRNTRKATRSKAERFIKKHEL